MVLAALRQNGGQHAPVQVHRRQHDLTRVHEFVATGFGQSAIANKLVLPGGVVNGDFVPQ